MITEHKELAFDFSDASVNRYFTESAIFFDIETTGFSPARTSLYLIGCATRRGDTLCLDQFFAESTAGESEVLDAFFALLAKKETILTFNGVGFDIPYLKAKCRSLGVPSPFENHACLDIYKEVSQLKTLLALPSFKQKSIEIFLGIDREDLFSGGELIEVYKNYTARPSREALSLLLQHNYEDVLYMPRLLSLLSYRDMLAGGCTVAGIEANETHGPDGTIGKELIFTLACDSPFPKPLSYRFDDCYLTFRHTDAKLCVRLLDGELRFYFDHPKDYYYLPGEDCAVLKSLATGVDREHRRQATAADCYTRKHAIFLPQYGDLFTPAFRKNRKDRKSYFALTEEFTADPALQTQYVRHLLSHMDARRPPLKKDGNV